jgi:hypothetical protein
MCHMRWPIIALTPVIGTTGATADFCSELQSALAQSDKFAKLSGTGGRTQQTNISVAGASSCSLSRATDGEYILSCTMLAKSSKEIEANELFSSLMTQLKSCLPPPKCSYRTKEVDDSRDGLATHSTNFVIDVKHKLRAYLSLLSLLTVMDFLAHEESIYDPHTGKQIGSWRTGFQYWIALVVVGQ